MTLSTHWRFKDGGDQVAREEGVEGVPRLGIKNKKSKTFFDFKQKKETRSKGVNASQLTIRNSNNITENLRRNLFIFT